MGILFAVLITITFGFAFNSVQSNTMSAALQSAFAVDSVAVERSNIGAYAVYHLRRHPSHRGVQQRHSAIMAVGYILLALFVVLTNVAAYPMSYLSL